jgi:hypothetical protein
MVTYNERVVNSLSDSFKELTLVSQEMLQERIETIKELRESDLEAYELVKDRLTGEYYLRYYYVHRDFNADGEKEIYNQLMPLESDDVISIELGEQSYDFPENWNNSFLRNGPDGHFVWFHPSDKKEYEEDIRFSQNLVEKLTEYKRKGTVDKESLRKLFDDIDKMENS